MSSNGSVLGPVFVFLICLAFAGGGGYMLWSQERAISGSERVTGTIESSSVGEETTQRDVDDDGMLEEETTYYARVTYTYTYRGQRYESSNVFPGVGDPSVGRGEAREIVDEHDAGSDAEVYVDPDEPSSAYLVRERSLALPVGFMLFGGVLALLSGFTAYSRITGDGEAATGA
jgi:hypothetical protein